MDLKKFSELLPVVAIGGTQYAVALKLNADGTYTNILIDVSAMANAAVWGSITGTITNQADLTAALALKAPLANPTFTGNVTLNSNLTFTPTVNNSLSGANQRLPTHGTANMVFTNAGLTSLASANNAGVSGGHTLQITNDTGGNLTLVNNYSGAAAGEAIYTGTTTDVVIPNRGSFWLQYDSTASAWIAMGTGLSFARDTMVDANKVWATGKTQVALTTLLTLPRTLTLPAANSFAAGTPILFLDEIQGISSTNTVTVTRAGADTINGATTFTLYTSNVKFGLITDGVSKWTGGIISTGSDGTYQAWTITYGGFSADPTNVVSRYTTIGKFCSFNINATAGTSSGAGSVLTITLPLPAANTAVQSIRMRGTDNSGTTANCILRTRVGSTTADVYPTDSLGTWQAGLKNVVGNGTYETL